MIKLKRCGLDILGLLFIILCYIRCFNCFITAKVNSKKVLDSINNPIVVKVDKHGKVSELNNNFETVEERSRSGENMKAKGRVNLRNYNKILVKRLIPHGHKSPELIYDSKLDIFYKPLVRVRQKTITNNLNNGIDKINNELRIEHYRDSGKKSNKSIERLKGFNDKALLELFEFKSKKQPKVNVAEELLLKDIANLLKRHDKRPRQKHNTMGYQNVLDVFKNLPNDHFLRLLFNTDKDSKKKGNKNIELLKRFNDETLLELFEFKPKKQRKLDVAEEILIKDIANLLNEQNKSPLEKHNDYEYLLEVLNDLNDDTLRSSFDKSGEELAKHESDDEPHEGDEISNVNKHKLPMPNYNLWNSWTYHQSIYQDMCPKNQVQFGNLCIWVPPH